MSSLMQKNKNSAGYLIVLVLIFGSIFMVIISSFIGYIVSQTQVVNFRHEQHRATEIAEAGLNYYRWFLAHFPGDVTEGTGVPGPYVHVYNDPEGGAIGEFSLDISSSTYCGDVSSIEVNSSAFTYDDPTAVSEVSARYSRPTVASYSVITNSGVWYGDSEPINGPVHTNQGIRMDGAHNSIVVSGQTDWTCDSSYGCSPDQTVDGVYTTSGLATPGLFSFPAAPIDFVGITLDLSNMKTKAQNNGGIYYGPTAGYGYSLVFNADGTVSVSRVDSTYNYNSWNPTEGTHSGERNVITGETLIATETINTDCPLLYFEDKVWVKGDVNQKVTLAAADLSSGGQTNVVLSGDIKYVNGTNAGLLVIAEDDVDVGVVLPDDTELYGIFIAQNGRFGRNYYHTGWFSGSYNYLDAYVTLNSLTQVGTVVSNARDNVVWVNSSGTVLSGFENRTISFDRNQVDSPPPLTPETSDVYEFTDWHQEG